MRKRTLSSTFASIQSDPEALSGREGRGAQLPQLLLAEKEDSAAATEQRSLSQIRCNTRTAPSPAQASSESPCKRIPSTPHAEFSSAEPTESAPQSFLRLCTTHSCNYLHRKSQEAMRGQCLPVL